jgi:hypothetical protein
MSVNSPGNIDCAVDLLLQGAPQLESVTIGAECKLNITLQHKSDTGLFNLFEFKGRHNFLLLKNLRHLRIAQNILLRTEYENRYKFPTAAECGYATVRHLQVEALIPDSVVNLEIEFPSEIVLLSLI